MAEKTKELSIKQDQSLESNRVLKGFENFDLKDLIVPRIRLLQALSKSVTDGDGKLGQFQDSLTNEIIGDKLDLVLIGLKNGAVYFKVSEGMVCKSDDGINSVSGDSCIQCPYNEYWGKFKANGVPPACSGTKEFLTVRRETLLSTPYPMLLSFLKTSYNLGKRLASMARLSGDDIFAQSYIIGSEKIQNAKGTFSQFTVKQGSKLNSDERNIAEKWFEMMNRSNVVVHDVEEQFINEV